MKQGRLKSYTACIVAVQYVQSHTIGRASCWEATCEPVYRDAATGKFLVPHALLVEGSSIIQTSALLGYALAEYPNGPESAPTHLPWIQNYIDHFRSIIEPKYACRAGKDLPPTRKTSPPMDLPSKPKTSRTPRRSRKPSRSSMGETTKFKVTVRLQLRSGLECFWSPCVESPLVGAASSVIPQYIAWICYVHSCHVLMDHARRSSNQRRLVPRHQWTTITLNLTITLTDFQWSRPAFYKKNV